MASITKINSNKGMVKLERSELVENDLVKWIRADSKGIGGRNFLEIRPIEKVAAKLYNEKYPSETVKLAEKCFLNDDGSVDVVLRVAENKAEGYYNTHPVKLNFEGFQARKRGGKDASVHLFTDDQLDDLIEHIASFEEKDLREIHTILSQNKVAVELLEDEE